MAVWTAEQLAEFLAFARGDPLYQLWQLIALRGLHRGEAAGLCWWTWTSTGGSSP
ncbi:hypothetical protein [Nonomuraea sp. NPDC005650]|uniref:hypothetical protein n=1 Tax=Nonomuraea sp. NPDC005650 TaxID=3157045 RepID=UPI0033B158B6